MPDTPSLSPQKSPFKGVLLVIIFVPILIAGFIFIPKFALPALNNARESARSIAAAKSLGSIGCVMIFYADSEGKGEFPTDAKQLFPSYINDERIFKRPGFPDIQDAHFMLVVGPKPDEGDMLLAFEIPPPDTNTSGRNVLLAGRSMAEWMSEEKFKNRLAQTEKTLIEAKRPFKLVPMNRSVLKR